MLSLGRRPSGNPPARLCLQPQRKSVLLCVSPSRCGGTAAAASWLARSAVGGSSAAALLLDWPAVSTSVRLVG